MYCTTARALTPLGKLPTLDAPTPQTVLRLLCICDDIIWMIYERTSPVYARSASLQQCPTSQRNRSYCPVCIPSPYAS